jgi:hypothetical protein
MKDQHLSSKEKDTLRLFNQSAIAAILKSRRWTYERTDFGCQQWTRAVDYGPRVVVCADSMSQESQQWHLALAIAFAYVEDLSTFESIAILSGGILPWATDDNAIAILNPKQRLIGE